MAARQARRPARNMRRRTESMTREQMKRYHAARRRRILRRQRRIFLMCSAAVLLVLFLFILKACGFFEKRSEVTTFAIHTDGSVTFEEVADVGDASGDEVRKFVKDAVKAYNKESKTKGVRIERFAEKDGHVYVRTYYKDADTYAAFTGLKCFAGSIADAKREGVDLSDVYVSVAEGQKGKTASIDEVLADGTKSVLMLEQNIRVVLPGTIFYVTDEATTVEDNAVLISTGDEETVVPVFIIYENDPESEDK
ncbi:MAG: hypothetical protein IJT32_02610 [Lachnospiraceae bacterium]|nr:hypothetical protein [Lachnospiraceae bacterium]